MRVAGRNEQVIFFDPLCGHCNRLQKCFDALGGSDYLDKNNIVAIYNVSPTDDMGVFLSSPKTNSFPHAFEFPAHILFSNGMTHKEASKYFVGKDAVWLAEVLVRFNDN